MSRETVEATAGRIAEHAKAHDLDSVDVILHGGEPLLAGHDDIRDLVGVVRSAVPVRVDVSVQTNATLLDTRFLRLFDELEIGVGVSLDGGQADHDRSRRTADGRGSYHRVAAALELLTSEDFRHLFHGLLCTVDLRNDPMGTYTALLGFDPPLIDFLLPHGNWSEPPPGRVPGSPDTPYATWLATVFDQWYATPSHATRVRLFDEIIHLLLGGESATEQIGLSPAAMIVIETDGEIEQSDLLKSAFEGAGSTGLHVARDSFDDLLLLPFTAARQIARLDPAPECAACEVGMICGGGLFAHRYRAGNGFHNPSVYCADLLSLIKHVGRTVQADVRRRTKDPR